MIHALLLASVLAGSPSPVKSVFVSFEDRTHLDGPSHARVLQAALAAAGRDGAAVRDISDVTRALFSPGMLVPEFDRPPPQGWPDALRPAWDEQMAACRERVAHAHGLARPSTAVACQRDLARTLFRRFLAELRPAAVLELSVSDAPGAPDGSRVAISARVFTPAQKPQDGRHATRVVPRSDLATAVREVASALLASLGAKP